MNIKKRKRAGTIGKWYKLKKMQKIYLPNYNKENDICQAFVYGKRGIRNSDKLLKGVIT